MRGAAGIDPFQADPFCADIESLIAEARREG
jgi:hypothetical protein